MALVNDFLVGADPEFVLIEGEHLKRFAGRAERFAPWGLDHNNWVVEPHPKPELSVRKLIENLKTALNDFATVEPTCKWRAGAFLEMPERTVTLGGHVHFDKPRCSGAQLEALDLFAQHLERLDALPTAECERRRVLTQYGHLSDTRNEHGHFEYRTLPSWLYSQRVAKVCLTGSKLAVVDPQAPAQALGTPATASRTKLKAYFERFKNKDEDADWVLSTHMLDKNLTIDPSRDLRTVWAVEPKKEDPRWKEAQARKGLVVGQPWPDMVEYTLVSLQDNNVRYSIKCMREYTATETSLIQFKLSLREWLHQLDEVVVRANIGLVNVCGTQNQYTFEISNARNVAIYA